LGRLLLQSNKTKRVTEVCNTPCQTDRFLVPVAEKHVCLYDVQNKDYHNRNVKKRAIKYLLTELGGNGWCFDLSLLFSVLFMRTVAAVAVHKNDDIRYNLTLNLTSTMIVPYVTVETWKRRPQN